MKCGDYPTTRCAFCLADEDRAALYHVVGMLPARATPNGSITVYIST
jgi:hypothetical protein